MIKQQWNGPTTVINNRVITPGAEIEVDLNDKQAKAHKALGYLKPPKPAAAKEAEKPPEAPPLAEKPAKKGPPT
jgi:hypothetical protein